MKMELFRFYGISLFSILPQSNRGNIAMGEIRFFGKIYCGFNISPAGSAISLAWAHADGAIGSAISTCMAGQLHRCSNC